MPTDATPMEVCYYEDAKPTGAAHERRRVLPLARRNGARNAKGGQSRLQPVLRGTGFMHARSRYREAIHLAPHVRVCTYEAISQRVHLFSGVARPQTHRLRFRRSQKTQHHVQAVHKRVLKRSRTLEHNTLHCDAPSFRRPPRHRRVVVSLRRRVIRLPWLATRAASPASARRRSPATQAG